MPHCPVADVEPRLYGDAGEERYRGCEVFGREAGMEACEQFFVECPSDDGHDVALFGRRDVAFADGFRRKVLPVRKGRCDGLCRGDQCVHDCSSAAGGGERQVSKGPENRPYSMLRMLYFVISDRNACWRSSSGS